MGRHVEGVARHHRGPAGKGATAIGHEVGVSVINGHVVQGHAQAVGAYLGHGGLVTLPQGRDAEVNSHLVRAIDHDSRPLIAGAGTGALDEACYANAGIAPVLLLARRTFDSVIVKGAEGLPQHLGIVATVIDHLRHARAGNAYGVGHIGRLQQVLQPKLGRVDAEVTCHDVQHPLAEVAGLVAARRAEGAHAGLVGQQTDHLPLVAGEMIGPHQKTGSGHGNERAVGAHVATQSAQYPRSHAQQGAVALGSDLDFTDVLPGVVGAQEVLAPVLHPLDGAAQLDGGEGHQEILRVELTTHAESSTDVGLDEVDAVLRHLQQMRQHAAIEMGHLGLAPNREFVPPGVIGGH